jgi:RimJ/RimL family protein N-acetyltransferase
VGSALLHPRLLAFGPFGAETDYLAAPVMKRNRAALNTEPISFRPMRHTDLPLLQRWLQLPHVNAWWHEPLDLAGVVAKYGPRIDGVEPTHMFVIEHELRAIGWIQWYRWRDYPAHAARLGRAR